jgi:hypothetical protein
MPTSPFKARLRVSVENPLAEVVVTDHRFAVVARSVGDLLTVVEPGVYKVTARLDDGLAERLVVLDRNLDVELGNELQIASAAPVDDTSRSHEYHRELAQ